MTDAIEISLKGKLGSFGLDVELSLPMHGISALFGPSGCGKTSVLRALAGLHRLPGRIAIGTEVWQDENRFVPPHKRALGYVFQEASLFEHMTVRQNLAYGLKRAGSAARHVEFEEIVTLLGVGHLVDRAPHNLSGGERQRVSIGRALLSQPRLLLMDEPLSALDRMAKDEILPYFEALHATLKIPMILVTHDISEVERLADHLVLMRAGKLVAAGPINDVLSASGSPLATRRDIAAVLPARVMRNEPDGLAVLSVEGAELLVLADGLAPGDAVRVRIAASDISIARTRQKDGSILNALDAKVLAIEPLGMAEASVLLDIGQTAPAQLRARITQRSLNALALKTSERVVAQIKGVSLAANR